MYFESFNPFGVHDKQLKCVDGRGLPMRDVAVSWLKHIKDRILKECASKVKWWNDHCDDDDSSSEDITDSNSNENDNRCIYELETTLATHFQVQWVLPVPVLISDTVEPNTSGKSGRGLRHQCDCVCTGMRAHQLHPLRRSGFQHRL